MESHVIRLSSIQHKASVHPVVTSLRTVCQSKKSAALGCWPATKAVKTMRIMATP